MCSLKLQTPSTEGARVHPTYLFFGGELYPDVFMSYYWICILELLLVEFGAPSGVLGIESWLALCKAYALPAVRPLRPRMVSSNHS